MGVIRRVIKPKTRRGKRELIKREPKIIENTKQGIFLRGTKVGDKCLGLLKDVIKIKKPHVVFLGSKKNEYRPFEATNELEQLCQKHDASLFGFGSHTKKRPNNLILGRNYDSQVLDMVEFGIENFKALEDFKNPKISVGTKPCLLFSGEPFQSPSSDFYRIKNLLIDFFHGEEITNVRLEGIEHVISFVAVENTIYMRSYRIILKKSGEKAPYVELDEIGPSADLVVRRSKLASGDLFKAACKKPKEAKVKKVKNISKDPFGSQLGRVHMPKQDLNKLPIRKMKGLRKSVAEKKVANNKAQNGSSSERQEQERPISNSRRRSPRHKRPTATGANSVPISSGIKNRK